MIKVTQERPPYMPINIKLETREQARAMFGLIDKVEGYRCSKDGYFTLTKNEISLVAALSNLHTDELIYF